MESYLTKIRTKYRKDDVFFNNEMEANYVSCAVCLYVSTLLIVVGILNAFGIFEDISDKIWWLVISGFLELMIPAYFCFGFKFQKIWIKYLLLLGITLFCSELTVLLTFRVPLFMLIPVLLSARYFSKKYTAGLSVVIAVLFAADVLLGVFFGSMDLNYVVLDEQVVGLPVLGSKVLSGVVNPGQVDFWATAGRIMLTGYIPQLVVFSIGAIVSANLAEKGRKMVEEQAEISTKSSRISSELELANAIQRNILPTVFPPFPEHTEFEIYAQMTPAKEVGGDFYDFYMLSPRKLGFVIADVSGKGVPAALFMMVSKTLIQNQALQGLGPADALTTVNRLLCERNETGLFVTAWLGVLDLETGVLTYSCAGHNPPLVKTKAGTLFPDKSLSDGGYKFLKNRSGLVLGGMAGIRYKESEIQLAPGDRIFLYTDGVTEATDRSEKLYGEERLVSFLNSIPSDDPEEVIKGVKADVDGFAGEAEQFDDITMLAVSFNGFAEKDDAGPLGPDADWERRNFSAEDSELESVLGFAEEKLEKYDCPMKFRMQLTVAVEEIFVNIAHYAYVNGKGDVEVLIGNDAGRLLIEFKDAGSPFNPIAHEDPDVTLSADERRIGGLGIFMVRKIMDDVSYNYENGKNVLRLYKQIGA